MNIDKEIIEAHLEENIEKIAFVVHEVWSHWQKHLHNQCKELPDGSLRIPEELVKQWNKQITLNYKQLTQSEKESDIEQAHKYIKIFMKIISVHDKNR